ncbi:MAG: hypothetical protein HOV79_27945 [Hamadaea sp.]|nr:hypothetical protein [Hamadaea sp.]
MSAVLHLMRDHYDDMRSNIVVWVDGRKVAKLPHGGQFSVDLPPGRHRLELSSPMGQVNGKLDFTVSAGQQLQLVCRTDTTFGGLMTKINIRHEQFLDGGTAAAADGSMFDGLVNEVVRRSREGG